MEAPFDKTKSKDDMFNFSGSASDMISLMKSAGIVVPNAEEAARKVAAAPASTPELATCTDPNCGHDHTHSGHEHSHKLSTSLSSVDSLEAFNAAVNDHSILVAVFHASWGGGSEKLLAFAETEAKRAGVAFLGLDLEDPDVESFALDLGVSEPGTVFIYSGGAKTADLKGAAATEQSVASALADMSCAGGSPACSSSSCDKSCHDHSHSHHHEPPVPSTQGLKPTVSVPSPHTADPPPPAAAAAGLKSMGSEPVRPSPQMPATSASSSSSSMSTASGNSTTVELVDASEGSVLLAWRSVPKAIKYELEWRPAAASTGEAEEAWAKLGSKGFASGLPPKQKSGLAPNTAFEFRVRGRDALDWFPWGPVTRYSTLPLNAPRLAPVTLLKAELNSLTVQWTDVSPPSAKGPEAAPTAATTFELQLREANDAGWTTVAPALKGLVARKRNLDQHGRYSFRVKPNDAGAGAEPGGQEGEEEGKKKQGWFFSAPNPVEFKAVPPVAPLFRELFGDTLLCMRGSSSVGVDALAGAVVAVYFSASWCPPCRQFTPQLAQFHQQAKARGLKFEVVFVSNDKDEGSMKEYFTHMPWLAVPFYSTHRNATMQRFRVNGIPHLKVFAPNGALADDNAVSSGRLTVENVAAWASGASGAPAVPPHKHKHSGGGSC